MERLQKRAEEMTRLRKEINQLKHDIQRLEGELLETGSTRTVTDCQRELEVLSDQSRATRRSIKRLHESREVEIRRQQNAENVVRDMREKVTAAEYKVKARERIEKQIEKIQEDYREQMKCSRVRCLDQTTV